MKITPWALDGCFRIEPRLFEDQRGAFRKFFHLDTFAEHGLATGFREQYYSVSHSGVLRGMHFQTPPHDHEKLVCCVRGEVLDAVVDLRRGSPTYGQSATTTLSDRNGVALYLPRGVAHGFLSRSEPSIVMYSVTTVHNPSCDSGIHWDSVGIRWPISQPVVSERDGAFPALGDWQSPFVFQPHNTRSVA